MSEYVDIQYGGEFYLSVPLIDSENRPLLKAGVAGTSDIDVSIEFWDSSGSGQTVIVMTAATHFYWLPSSSGLYMFQTSWALLPTAFKNTWSDKKTPVTFIFKPRVPDFFDQQIIVVSDISNLIGTLAKEVNATANYTNLLGNLGVLQVNMNNYNGEIQNSINALNKKYLPFSGFNKTASGFSLIDGTERAGTYNATKIPDSNYHQIGQVEGSLNAEYHINVGGIQLSPSSLTIFGRLVSSDDITLSVLAMNFSTNTFEPIGEITSRTTLDDFPTSFPLHSNHKNPNNYMMIISIRGSSLSNFDLYTKHLFVTCEPDLSTTLSENFGKYSIPELKQFASAFEIIGGNGTVDSGSLSDTNFPGGSVHQIIPHASGMFDCQYDFNIGSRTYPTMIVLKGLFNHTPSQLNVYLYDFENSRFDNVGSIKSQQHLNINTSFFHLFKRHVGSGDDEGIVRMTISGVGIAGGIFMIDQLFVTYKTDGAENYSNINNHLSYQDDIFARIVHTDALSAKMDTLATIASSQANTTLLNNHLTNQDTEINKIVTKLPQGLISDLSLATQIDGETIEYILEVAMMQANGSYDKEVIGNAEDRRYRITGYKRTTDSNNILTVYEIDENEGTRRRIQ